MTCSRISVSWTSLRNENCFTKSGGREISGKTTETGVRLYWNYIKYYYYYTVGLVSYLNTEFLVRLCRTWRLKWKVAVQRSISGRARCCNRRQLAIKLISTRGWHGAACARGGRIRVGCRGTFHSQFKASCCLPKSPATHFFFHDINIFYKFLSLFDQSFTRTTTKRQPNRACWNRRKKVEQMC